MSAADDVSEQPGVAAVAAAFGGLRRDPVVLALLAACGPTECHLVGGALRDRALGLVTHDLDAVVAGRGREIAGELADRLPARLVLLGGRDFAAYRLVLLPSGDSGQDGGGDASDASDASAGGDASDAADAPAGGSTSEARSAPGGAAGVRVLDLWDRQGTPLADDLARRDFTVNSFALEPRGGALVDPFSGLADLARRTLRATTGASFDGDPLRVLRLARLLVRLPGFTVEPQTFALARRAAPRLPEMAAERIRDELWLLLSPAGAERGLRALAALGLYPGLWLGAPGSTAGEAGEAAASRAAAEIAALPARATELERLLAAAAAPSAPVEAVRAGLPPYSPAGEPQPAIDLAVARFAATFRHLPGALPRMQEAGYLSSRQAAAIAPLLDGPAELPESVVGRRRFLARHGRGWLTVACSLGAAAAAADAADAVDTGGTAALGRWRRAAVPLCELARREGPDLLAPPRLLTGEDVQRLLGIPPGPEVGSALAALGAAQVDGAVRTRDEAERFLRDWRGERRRDAAAPLPPEGGQGSTG